MNSGVKQWVFQRIANALAVAFGITLLCVFLLADEISYSYLSSLLSTAGMQIYLAVLLVFCCLNSVLAAWQIDGDYAKKFGLPSQLITIIATIVSAGYLFYGLGILF